MVAEVLDRFTKCRSTVKYNGRKARWDVQVEELNSRTEIEESCDLFSGKWVFDNSSHPLYKESDCPYMSDQLACHRHGRPDLGYQYWRWQPHSCNLKRYLESNPTNGLSWFDLCVLISFVYTHSSFCLCYTVGFSFRTTTEQRMVKKLSHWVFLGSFA